MKIVAFLDTSLYARSVIDHTAWLAAAKKAQVELVHIVSSNELVTKQIAPMHPSGAIVVDRDEIFQGKLEELKRRGRARLDEAREVLNAAGVFDVQVRMPDGNVAHLMEQAAADASIVVMGKRGEHADLARLTLGSEVERLVRAITVPVLAVSRSFRPISRMLLAIDGDTRPSPAVSPLTDGLLPPSPLHLLHVGGEGNEQSEIALARTARQLGDAGIQVSSELVAGEPRRIVPQRIIQDDIDLLAIGAFRSPRLKSLILGSLTEELIRACQVPVLLC